MTKTKGTTTCYNNEQQQKLLPYINNFFLIIQSIRAAPLSDKGSSCFNPYRLLLQR